jgi:DNA-binding response OmpR family regulator
MICDDEPDLLELFGTAFKSKYNVILVSSGEDCINRFIEKKIRGNKIHLILLDYRLNDISGGSVARKIMFAGLIFLISAYRLEESKCITRYVRKPIHFSSLIKLMEETLS